jgi:hypothetical protein
LDDLSPSERAVLRSYIEPGASGFDRAVRLSLQYAVGAGMFTAAAILEHNAWWSLATYATFLAFLAIRLRGARHIANVMPGIIAKYEDRIRELEKHPPATEASVTPEMNP